jgi:hypothetical protein
LGRVSSSRFQIPDSRQLAGTGEVAQTLDLEFGTWNSKPETKHPANLEKTAPVGTSG